MASALPSDVRDFRSLVELLAYRAHSDPDACAYTFLHNGESEQARLTHRALHSRVRAVASRLREIGAAGKTVVLLYPPELEYIAAFFGCLYAGVIAVPAYPPDPSRLRRTLPRLQAIVADSGAAYVL